MRSNAWLKLTVAEMAFDAGEWRAAQEALSPSPTRAAGLLFIYRKLMGALVALGVGDEDGAADCLDATQDLVEVTNQPQWIGLYGALRADLLLRRRDLTGAQRAVQDTLDRLEICTDDVSGIAWVSCVGLCVEADRAQRARDLRETGDRRDALARARLHADRLAATAHDGGPVEHARLTQGRAELARARGRSGAREWRRAAAGWDEIKRPYPAAIARWREAEALAAADDRAGAAEAAGAALATAEASSARSGWRARCARWPSARAWISAAWRWGPAAATGPRCPRRPGTAAVVGRARPGPPRTPSASPRASARSWPCWPRGRPTARSAPRCTWPRRPPACTCRGSWPSSGVQGRTQAAAVAHRLHLA